MNSHPSDSLTVFSAKAWPLPLGREQNTLPREAHGSPVAQRADVLRAPCRASAGLEATLAAGL